MTPWHWLSVIDRTLFHWINTSWANPFFDHVMPAVTNVHKIPWFLYGVCPALIAFWFWREGRRALRVLVVAALAIAACDTLAYRVLKPMVARPRPFFAGIGAIVRSPSGGTMGFPSNHAINAGAGAAVLSVAYPPFRYLFWGGAALIAYSRVYCGVHYPADVLAGLLVGGLLSWFWAVLMLDSSRRKK